jgi:transposase
MHFSAKNNVTTLELPPYSPELAPAEFYLFPQLKSALKVQHFYDANDIIKNMTEELKMLSQMASMNVSNTFTVAGRSI